VKAAHHIKDDGCENPELAFPGQSRDHCKNMGISPTGLQTPRGKALDTYEARISTYLYCSGDRTAEAILDGALKGFLTGFDIRFASCSMKTAYLNSSCEIAVGSFDVADRIGAAMKSARN
jgi:hypothetical protein